MVAMDLVTPRSVIWRCRCGGDGEPPPILGHFFFDSFTFQSKFFTPSTSTVSTVVCCLARFWSLTTFASMAVMDLATPSLDINLAFHYESHLLITSPCYLRNRPAGWNNRSSSGPQVICDHFRLRHVTGKYPSFRIIADYFVYFSLVAFLPQHNPLKYPEQEQCLCC